MTKIDLSSEAPDVVIESTFLSRLERGWFAEVVASEDAYTKAALWKGSWHIRVVNDDLTREEWLATYRDARKRREATETSKYRTFKTANGLISYLAGIGFKVAHIPLEAGGFSRLTKEAPEST